MNDIELQPVLLGDTIKLRPLKDGDFEALYSIASDPKIWELHPDNERYKREIFKQRYFKSALVSGGALVVEQKSDGEIIGCSRYYEWRPGSKEISIGYTFIKRSHWGLGANREIKQLMLNHIFLWANLAWFHVGEINMRSRRAVEKLGARLSHAKQRELEGAAYTQLYYKLADKGFLG